MPRRAPGEESYCRGTVLCQGPQDPVWVCGGGDEGETISGFFRSWWLTLENKVWGLGKRHCMSVQVPGSWQKENFNRFTETLYVKILSLQRDNGIISLDPWQSSELKRRSRDFPGGPVVNFAFQRRGCGFNLWAKVPHASWPKNQNIKQKQYCNKFSKGFKKKVHIKKIFKKGSKFLVLIYMCKSLRLSSICYPSE